MGIKLKTRTRELPCKLTDVEVQIAGTELASAVEAVKAEQERQKQIKTDLKAKLTELNVTVAELAAKVSHREEMRDVDINIVLIPDTMLVQEVRTDTGEIITTRKAEPDELQTSLDD